MVAKFSKFGKHKDRVFENTIVMGVIAAVLAGVIVFFLYQNMSMAQKRSALDNRLQALLAQTTEMEEQKALLEVDIKGTKEEEYQERVLREQGLYKKEGEQVITILPPEDASNEPVEEKGEQKRIWWNLFSWF